MKKKPNHADKDFDRSLLPTTRKDLFFDLYRNNRKTITKTGVMYLLFALPLLAFGVVMFLVNISMTEENYPDNLDAVLALWNLLYVYGSLLLWIPLLIALAGNLEVYKRLFFQEGLIFSFSFKKGIKENFKPIFLDYLLHALLFGFGYLLVFLFRGAFYSYTALFAYFLLFFPIFLYHTALVSLYQGKFSFYVQNGAYFFFHTIGFSLLFSLGFLLPFVIDFLPIPVTLLYISVKYSVYLLLLLFYYPALSMVFLLYAYSHFDESINKENYPELYRKGLYDLDSESKSKNERKKDL